MCHRTEFGKCWLKVMMPGLVQRKHEDLCKSAPPAFHLRQAWERAGGTGVDPFLKVGKTACLSSESSDSNGNLNAQITFTQGNKGVMGAQIKASC